MKRLSILVTIIALLSFACEGPQGPPGLDGLNGLDGINADEGFVFEYELNFTAPDYSALLELPGDFNMLESDVMLVYFLWEVTDENVEVWRQLPQTLYLNEGILEYNFDWTRFDANVFLDGTVNFDMLGADFTDNWIARVVVVPGQFTGRTDLDYSDYNQVKAFFNLSDSKLASRDYQKRPN